MSKIKIIAASSVVAAAIAMLGAALPAQRLTTEAPPQEALPMTWVVSYMARKSSADLLELRYQDGTYQATLRYRDGRVGRVEVDSVSARIRSTESTDLFSNSVDIVPIDDAATPINGLRAHQVVERLMATGRYRALLGLRLDDSGWRAALEDNGGRRLEITVDPRHGGDVAKFL